METVLPREIGAPLGHPGRSLRCASTARTLRSRRARPDTHERPYPCTGATPSPAQDSEAAGGAPVGPRPAQPCPPYGRVGGTSGCPLLTYLGAKPGKMEKKENLEIPGRSPK